MAGKIWPDEEIAALRDAVQRVPGDNLRTRCNALDGWNRRTSNAIYTAALRAPWHKDIDYTQYEGPGETPTVEALRGEVGQLRKENEKLREWHHEFNDAAERAAVKLPPLKIKRPRPSTPKSGDYVYNLILGDWQAGQAFKSGDAAGLSEYNSEIMARRVDVLIEKFFILYEKHKTIWPAKRIIVDLLGDFVEGINIYPGQAFYLDQKGVDQVFSVLDHLTRVVGSLAEAFPNVTCYAVVGNHGRLSKDAHALDNLDYFLYRILKERFKPYHGKVPYEGVKVLVSAGKRMLYEPPEIPWMVHALNHGDSLKSQLGVPYYAADREVGRIVQNFNKPINCFKWGHHHNRASRELPNYGRWMINGSLVGGSPYSVDKMGTATAPSQTLLILHSDVGVVSEETLYVDKRVELKPDANGVYTGVVE